MSGPVVGNNILSLITTGMYNDPLSIYREYLQNAADAMSNINATKESRVEIDIDTANLRIRIRDNGPGLTRQAAIRALLPVSQSQKQYGTDRGFRGIGRLSGLAFADTVAFNTRTWSDKSVTRIVWDSTRLCNAINENKDIESVIRDCVEIETLSGAEYPAHFFEVEINNVVRHVAGLILNKRIVQDYISEVCPIPIASEFPFASKVENTLDEDKSSLTLNIFLNGEDAPIKRPYGQMISFSEDRKAHFTEFEQIFIPSVDSNENAAVGWIAHSSYLGAIPKSVRVRGIRARVGNMQIGDDTVFDHLFPEERFNRWCVGELHVLDRRIIPNGRRDYFEPSPHIRNLENQMGAIVRKVVMKCRKASSERNKTRKFQTFLQQIEDTYDLVISGYLSTDQIKEIINQTRERIQNIRENIIRSSDHESGNLKTLEELEEKFIDFHPPMINPQVGCISKTEVSTYLKVFKTLIEVSESPTFAKKMIETLLERA